MKIIISIILLLVAFAVSTSSEGAEWKLYQFHPQAFSSFADKTSDERIYFRYKRFIDIDSVVVSPKKEVRAWRKELFIDAKIEKDLLSQYILIEVDCLERKYRYLKWRTELNDLIMAKAIIEEPKIKAGEWDYLTPDQGDELLYKTWCSYLPKKK